MTLGAIYARQSVTKDGSESLEIQLERCREAATRLGVEVVAELVEAPSTSGFKNRGRGRAKFIELLDLVRTGTISAIMVYKSERLSRGGGPGWAPVFDAIDAAGLNPDRAVATPNGWMSEFEIGIRATMDREESKKLSSRITDNHARKARSGKPKGGGRRPFGYERDLVTVKEEEAELIREAARRVLSGESALAIVNDWNKRGIRSASGLHWRKTVLINLLRGPRLAGLRVHQGVLLEGVTGSWVPILDPETWHAVGAMLDTRRRPPGHVQARKFLLNGFVFCERCGARMHTRTAERGGVRRGQYVCVPPHSSGAADACGRTVIQADIVEALAYEEIESWLLSDEARQMATNIAETPGGEDVGAELVAIRDKIARVKEMRIEGDLTKAEFRQRIQGLEAAQGDLIGRLRGSTPFGILKGMPSDPEGLKQRWDSETLEWQRAQVDLWIDRIEVGPGRGRERLTLVPRHTGATTRRGRGSRREKVLTPTQDVRSGC